MKTISIGTRLSIKASFRSCVLLVETWDLLFLYTAHDKISRQTYIQLLISQALVLKIEQMCDTHARNFTSQTFQHSLQ